MRGLVAIALITCGIVIPRGCNAVGAFEDGTIIATCSDGSKVAIYDPDGQPYVNTAGVPVRPAGWYGGR